MPVKPVKSAFYFRLLTVVTTLSCVSCSVQDGWMTLQGYRKMTCDLSEYVDVGVQNLSDQPVDFKLCSPDTPSPVVFGWLPSQSKITLFRTIIRSLSKEYWIHQADSCEVKSLRPHSIGDQIPILLEQDTATLKICLNPNGNDLDPQRYWSEVYQIVGLLEACPQGSEPFDPSSVECQYEESQP